MQGISSTAMKVAATIPSETPLSQYDPETITLELIEETTQWLLQEWPKEDGIPFPSEVFQTLKDLKLKVWAQDAKQVLRFKRLLPNKDENSRQGL